jgi:hypothetical protein
MSVNRGGVAAREITPPPCLDIAGSLSAITGLGTRDPLLEKALVLDDVAPVAIRGEHFVEYGPEIKHTSPFPRTLIVTLATEWIGYIPHRTAFEGGGYEKIYASHSRHDPEAREMAVEAVTTILQEAARPSQ